MEVNELFNVLKANEKLILKESEFILIKKEENIWEITVKSIHGENAFVIEKVNNTFNVNKVSRNDVYPIFKAISGNQLVHGFVFYMISFWGQYFSLPNYEKVSNDMTLEEAIQSLQMSLKELKFSCFNTSKGVILKQMNDEMYSLEIQIQNEIKTEIDTLDIIAKTAYFLSKKIHDFYTIFYKMGIDSQYEDECKKFYLYDSLYRVPLIDFFRDQKLSLLRNVK